MRRKISLSLAAATPAVLAAPFVAAAITLVSAAPPASAFGTTM
jgi:hypothetical protein